MTVHLLQGMQSTVKLLHIQLPFNVGLHCSCKVESIINSAANFSTNRIHLSAPLSWLLTWFAVENKRDVIWDELLFIYLFPGVSLA